MKVIKKNSKKCSISIAELTSEVANTFSDARCMAINSIISFGIVLVAFIVAMLVVETASFPTILAVIIVAAIELFVGLYTSNRAAGATNYANHLLDCVEDQFYDA